MIPPKRIVNEHADDVQQARNTSEFKHHNAPLRSAHHSTVFRQPQTWNLHVFSCSPRDHIDFLSFQEAKVRITRSSGSEKKTKQKTKNGEVGRARAPLYVVMSTFVPPFYDCFSLYLISQNGQLNLAVPGVNLQQLTGLRKWQIVSRPFFIIHCQFTEISCAFALSNVYTEETEAERSLKNASYPEHKDSMVKIYI